MIRAARVDGELEEAVMPACAKAADTSGRTIASLNTADVASTVVLGTLPEAKKANHSLMTSSAYPCSTNDGTSGR
jgi:hypothetical protein